MSSLSSILIGGAKHAVPLLSGVFRKYYTAITTTALIQGITDVSHKAIVWKVGARFPYQVAYDLSDIDAQVARMVQADPVAYRGSKKRKELRARLVRKARTKETETSSSETAPPGLACPPTDSTAIQQPFKVAEAIAADFAALARKYTGITGGFLNADMSGLVSRLIAGLAHYTLTGEITMTDLAGGNVLKLVAAGNHTTPLVASNTSVWVPRNIDTLMTPNVLAALTAACAAIGSTLVTDIVAVDTANAPIIPTADGADLAEGMYQALRIIGGNMEHNGAGSLFAYAITHGVHNVVSVAGMTDEGGFMRSVLRTSFFAPSYGGISTAHVGWNGLPRPADLSLTGWTALVDAVALTSAACVAISDPCMSVGGRVYPSTFSGTQSKKSTSGTDAIGDENDAAALCAKIGSAVPAFASNYVKALTRAFEFTPNSNGEGAIAHLTLSFFSPALLTDRHLMYPSVSPFYWVEPTGIINFDCSDFTAVKAGYGPMAAPGRAAEMPMFEACEVVEALGDFSEVNVGWRSARTSGLVLHLGNHVLDGLAHAKIVGGDCDAWAQLGGQSLTVSTRMDQGDDLASYLWSRSDVGIPAPGEALYFGEGLAMVTKHASMDTTGWVMSNTHFPTPLELLGNVKVEVAVLCPYESGGLGPDRHANRAYTDALKALDAARVTGGMRTTRGIGRIRKTDIRPGPSPPAIKVSSPAPPPGPGHAGVAVVPNQAHTTQSQTAQSGPPLPLTYTAGPKQVPGVTASSVTKTETAAQRTVEPEISGSAEVAGTQ